MYKFEESLITDIAGAESQAKASIILIFDFNLR